MATEEKLDLEKLRVDQALEISRLTRENSKLKKSIRGYQGLESQKHIKQPENNHEHPEQTTKEPENTSKIPHEDEKPHFVGPWQQWCPTCGDKNPNFKDESKCTTCGMHLGEAEAAKKLKACPNCGGKKAELIVRTNTGTTTA